MSRIIRLALFCFRFARELPIVRSAPALLWGLIPLAIVVFWYGESQWVFEHVNSLIEAGLGLFLYYSSMRWYLTVRTKDLPEADKHRRECWILLGAAIIIAGAMGLG